MWNFFLDKNIFCFDFFMTKIFLGMEYNEIKRPSLMARVIDHLDDKHIICKLKMSCQNCKRNERKKMPDLYKETFNNHPSFLPKMIFFPPLSQMDGPLIYLNKKDNFSVYWDLVESRKWFSLSEQGRITHWFFGASFLR